MANFTLVLHVFRFRGQQTPTAVCQKMNEEIFLKACPTAFFFQQSTKSRKKAGKILVSTPFPASSQAWKDEKCNETRPVDRTHRPHQIDY